MSEFLFLMIPKVKIVVFFFYNGKKGILRLFHFQKSA